MFNVPTEVVPLFVVTTSVVTALLGRKPSNAPRSGLSSHSLAATKPSDYSLLGFMPSHESNDFRRYYKQSDSQFVVTTSVVTALLGVKPSNAPRSGLSAHSLAGTRPSDYSCDGIKPSHESND